jgi:hypothetical protein
MNEKKSQIGLWGWGFICSVFTWFFPYCMVYAECGENNWVGLGGFIVLILLGLTSWAGVGLALGLIIVKLVELA